MSFRNEEEIKTFWDETKNFVTSWPTHKKMAEEMNLVLNPTKHVQDLYTENDKMLMEEIKEYCI